MRPSDLGFANSVRALAGWNQTDQDWRRFLHCEPEGCFVAEWDGSPVGTATTTCYSSELGWIGMMLVHPDYRQHGIGSALLRHCLDHLRARGVRGVKLDATPLGQVLYERFGFQPELTLTRWEILSAQLILGAPSSSEVQPGKAEDLEQIAALDREAFGTLRIGLLGQLANGCAHFVVQRGFNREITGYGMARKGSRAFYLGPVAAKLWGNGTAIIERLLSMLPGQPVFWDVFDGNAAATALARTLGFTAQRHLLRMFHGENLVLGDPNLQFAIIDPAVG